MMEDEEAGKKMHTSLYTSSDVENSLSVVATLD